MSDSPGGGNGGSGSGDGIGGFFNVTPAQLLLALASRVKGYAKDAGTACSMPGGRRRGRRLEECDSLTLGIRCEGCSRRICAGHTYWRVAGVKVLPYCPFCVVSMNDDLFEDDEDGDDE